MQCQIAGWAKVNHSAESIRQNADAEPQCGQSNPRFTDLVSTWFKGWGGQQLERHRLWL